MKVRMIMMSLLLCLVGTLGAQAQDAKTKARMADIRSRYAKAVKLAESGKNGSKKNYQVFTSYVTDPTGEYKKNMEFFFDNSKDPDDLEIYPCQLMLVRETSDGYYCEYLYDDAGELLFFFESIDQGDGKQLERRVYLNTDGTGWKWDKHVDKKTKRVLSEEQEPLDNNGVMDHAFTLRHANDVYRGFQHLNAIYE